jgi:hypothetical protein
MNIIYILKCFTATKFNTIFPDQQPQWLEAALTQGRFYARNATITAQCVRILEFFFNVQSTVALRKRGIR